MTFIVFFVSVLAALRLTRLAIADSITQPFRDRIATLASRGSRSSGAWEWFEKLFSCPWCAGFWISAATTALALHLSHLSHTITQGSTLNWWVAYAGLTFATSWLVGFIYTIDYTIEEWEPNEH